MSSANWTSGIIFTSKVDCPKPYKGTLIALQTDVFLASGTSKGTGPREISTQERHRATALPGGKTEYLPGGKESYCQY